MKKAKLVLIGTGFIAGIHTESLKRFVPQAEIVAVFSNSEANAEAFAKKHGIPRWGVGIDAAMEVECDIVDICIPNYLHKKAAVAALDAGRHVIIEKPLCVTLSEADAMLEAAKRNGKKLMYAEELCFAPKYERVRALVKEGAVGEVYMLKQSEKHSGPHSAWFYDINLAGGGVLMDMGCHAAAWFRWMTGGAKVKSVQAHLSTVLHKNITGAEDNAVMIIEFENGVIGVAEDSWARHGGMDDRIEVYGTQGLCYADLFMGNAVQTYSKNGYGYAMEKSDTTKGWTFTIFEEMFNQGYPHELQHFVDCVINDTQPLVTGEDGKAALEILYAAYAAAGQGKKIEFPFSPDKSSKPVDGWING